jgi:endonuclease-3
MTKRAQRRSPTSKRTARPSGRGSAKQRIGPIIDNLKKQYPNAKCALHHRNPLELLIATILSAQCTDTRVNIVTKDLFTRYRTAEDYANADPEEFALEIKSTGFFRNKTKSILGMARALVDNHDGMVPASMDELVEMPGVGRKTANVVLGNAFDANEGVVVDTHVKRIANRLQLTNHADPEKIERDLVRLVPQPEWTLFSHLLIFHGRQICLARKPKCEICPVNTLCPTSSA